jgi:sugar transferase (PEP-CTERM system associated)
MHEDQPSRVHMGTGNSVAKQASSTYLRDAVNQRTQIPTGVNKWFTQAHGAGLLRIGGLYLHRKTVVLALSEGFVILFALGLATLAQFASFTAARGYLGETENWWRCGLVIIVCQFVQWCSDLYDLRGTGSRSAMSLRTVRATGTAMLGLAILYGLLPTVRLVGSIPITATLFSVPLILTWRFSFDSDNGIHRPMEAVLILGTGEPGIKLAQELLRRPELRYRVVGFLAFGAENMGMPLAEPGIIGGISQLREIVARERVDRVVIALAERRGVMPVRELTALRMEGVRVEDAHSVYERIAGRILLDRLHPSWLILSNGFNQSMALLAAKRAIDICVSLSLIVIASPLLLLTALAVLLETGGPILFRQERVGLGGRAFQIVKFRSMKLGSEKGAPSWTRDNDPRVTHVGAFIRKYRLDELPQLLNVLRGEMSLIGPRPEVPYFCELLEREIPLYNQRHCVRPGISGWAQVRFKYGASLEEAKLKFEFDLYYIKNLSILFDLAIALETIRVILLGKGAK